MSMNIAIEVLLACIFFMFWIIREWKKDLKESMELLEIAKNEIERLNAIIAEREKDDT